VDHSKFERLIASDQTIPSGRRCPSKPIRRTSFKYKVLRSCADSCAGAAFAGGRALVGAGSDSYPGRYILLFQTEQADVKYEWIYGYVTVVGTGKSITFRMFISMFPVE
jgi:hypothetical protein